MYLRLSICSVTVGYLFCTCRLSICIVPVGYLQCTCSLSVVYLQVICSVPAGCLSVYLPVGSQSVVYLSVVYLRVYLGCKQQIAYHLSVAICSIPLRLSPVVYRSGCISVVCLYVVYLKCACMLSVCSMHLHVICLQCTKVVCQQSTLFISILGLISFSIINYWYLYQG